MSYYTGLRVALAASAVVAVSFASHYAQAQTSYPSFRIEGGLGYDVGISDLKASTSVLGLPVALTGDLLGASGLAANAGIWYDGAFGQPGTFPGDISIGAQYLHLTNDGSITASAGGLASAKADLSLNTDAVMANIAWRVNDGSLHPFIGAGIGVAFNEMSVGGSIAAGGLGLAGSATLPSDSETAFAAQAFFGFDYDFTPNIYGGVTGRYVYSDATYSKLVPASLIPGGVKLDLASNNLAVMAHLGWRF